MNLWDPKCPLVCSLLVKTGIDSKPLKTRNPQSPLSRQSCSTSPLFLFLSIEFRTLEVQNKFLFCHDFFCFLFGFCLFNNEHITYSKGRREASFHPSVSSSICPSVWSSIHPIMVCLLRRGGERLEYRLYVTEKAIRNIVKDVMKHHFIHLSHHPFVHPFGHPSISSWSVYSDEANKEWNTNAVWRRKQYEEMAHMPKTYNDGTDG